MFQSQVTVRHIPVPASLANNPARASSVEYLCVHPQNVTFTGNELINVASSPTT